MMGIYRNIRSQVKHANNDTRNSKSENEISFKKTKLFTKHTSNQFRRIYVHVNAFVSPELFWLLVSRYLFLSFYRNVTIYRVQVSVNYHVHAD